MKRAPLEFLRGKSALLRNILWQRGVREENDALTFFNPSYEQGLHNPFLLKGMKEVVSRITVAVKGNERIAIFADYDCDGTAAAAVLADYFHCLGFSNFLVYVPERIEGYGLTKEAIVKIAEGGANLLVTVDCGIANYNEVEFAKGLGLDVIVTDHHLPPEVMPRCAVINPKQPSCIYPEKMLCGAGVAFKLVCALITLLPIPNGQEKWLLDLVALATLADQVPLRGENRVLVYFGMKVLSRTRRPGLLQIINLLRLRRIGEEDVTFSIVPRLNSVSRILSSALVFETLSTKDISRANELVKILENTNKERKTLVAQTMREANKRLRERDLGNVIVLGDPDWNLGILGLVAAKISEEYTRPAFVWTRVGELIKGSCRSPKLDLVDLMKRTAPETLVSFGGHSLAGGFVATSDQVHFLEAKLESAFDESKGDVAPNTEDKEISDGIFNLADVNLENFRIIDCLRPFGNSFPRPIFLFENLLVTKTRRFGQNQNHLSMTLEDGGENVEAVSFFEKRDNFSSPQSILASIEKDWRGRLRLRIEKFL
ncbi:MAG TPA: single-stranded-DNA-specific exonuclease RecJ [Candidatus Paceibacterota bacterium]|nr:single-stranded-DNA-specific exonuclease RecJ [Candidatus Paceibacterota bacterium]